MSAPESPMRNPVIPITAMAPTDRRESREEGRARQSLRFQPGASASTIGRFEPG